MNRNQAHEKAFRNDRVLALQEITGLNQKELSSRIGVSQSYFSMICSRKRPLPEEVAQRAAQEFNLPESFFTVQPHMLDLAIPTFRKSSKAKRADEKRIVRFLREATRGWMETANDSSFRTASDVLGLSSEVDVEEAASIVRQAAGLDQTEPVRNMVRLAEKLGIAVITNLDGDIDLSMVESHHVGGSLPSRYNPHPLIALVKPVRGDVARLTLAHEVGHLIYDKDRDSPIISVRSPEERRAYGFAGALLVPEGVARANINNSTTLRDFLALKSEYGVSVGALVSRGRQLGCISPDRAKSLHIQINSRGWRQNEPVPVAEETPILFGQALRRVTPSFRGLEVSRRLGWAFDWFSRWIPDGSDDDGARSKVVEFDFVARQRLRA